MFVDNRRRAGALRLSTAAVKHARSAILIAVAAFVGLLACPAIAVQCTLFDNTSPDLVDGCNLVRSGLTVAGAATAQTLASVPDTGVPEMPGTVRYSTTSIAFATIEDAQYGFWFEYHLSGSGVGIFGSDAIYTITAPKG